MCTLESGLRLIGRVGPFQSSDIDKHPSTGSHQSSSLSISPVVKFRKKNGYVNKQKNRSENSIFYTKDLII